MSTIICHVLELDKSKYTSPLITCTLATTIVELYFRKKKLYSILGSNYFEKCKQKILEPKELELRIQCSNLKSILLNLGFIEFDGGIKDYEFLEVLSNKQYKRFKNNLKINRNQKYISHLNKSEQLFKYKLYQVITIKELKKEDII